MTRIGTIALALATTLALVACDPKTPVQTSDITTQMDQKIAAHNADATAHPNLQITSGQLTDQIPTGKIADAAIVAAKIANGAVGSTQLAPGAVTAPAIAAGAVQTASIGDLMVTTAKLADNGVTAAKIANGTITTTQLSATAGITGSQLAAGANIAGTQLAANANIAGTQLANNTITATQIANNTITAAQIANGAITTTQINAAAGITGAQLANSTITEANVALANAGSGNSTMFTAFYPLNTDNGWSMNTPVAITFTCTSMNGMGQIDVFDGAAEVAGSLTSCDGFLKKITFNLDKMKTYSIRYRAKAAAQPVTWQGIVVSY